MLMTAYACHPMAVWYLHGAPAIKLLSGLAENQVQYTFS